MTACFAKRIWEVFSLKQNQTTRLFIVLISVLFIAAGVLANGYVITSGEANFVAVLESILIIVALVSALFYIFLGYKKDAAHYFKLFLYLFALAQLVSIVNATFNPEHTTLSVALAALTYAPVLILASAKDLGRRVSLILCGIVIAVYLFIFVGAAFTYPGSLRGDTSFGTFVLIRDGALLLLSLIMGVITFAKYVDKAERHTT